jgi:carboxypeptidase C (cathepsin A)
MRPVLAVRVHSFYREARLLEFIARMRCKWAAQGVIFRAVLAIAADIEHGDMKGSMAMRRINTGRLALLLMAIASLHVPAGATDLSTPAVTQHAISIGTGQMTYVAETGQIAIVDVATGEPHGYMFYTAYRMAGSSGQPRPLTFVWNGGPGSDSSTLHFRMVGPKIWRDDHLVDNPDTWLRNSDLVFIDPIGTGFSRPTKREYASEFYSKLGDTSSISEFVRVFVLQHGDEARDVYLTGESYGVARAANVGYRLEKNGIPVSGLILISGGFGMTKSYSTPSLQAALHVSEMNHVAAFHGKAAPADPAEIDHFARDIYAPALDHKGKLSDAERAKVISGLQRYTGLTPLSIDPISLKITAAAFRKGLLQDQGKVLDQYDMRLTQPTPELGVEAVTGYLRNDLGYNTPLTYVPLQPQTLGYAPGDNYPASPGDNWDWSTVKMTEQEVAAAIKEATETANGPPKLGPPLPGVEEGLAINPGLRVFYLSGLEDSYNSCAGNADAIAHFPAVLRKAVTFRCYEGGHMMYTDVATRKAVTADIDAFYAHKIGQ